MIILLLTASFVLSSCNSTDTASTVSEQYANADDYLYRTWGYASQKDFEFENAIWLTTDSSSLAYDVKVPMGTVLVSPYLVQAMEDMPDNLRLRVIVCFKSMVPDNYLDTLSYGGKTYAEYREILDTLENEEEREQAGYAIRTMTSEYYNTMFDSLDFKYETWNLGGIQYNFSFYACMTKKEILELTCDEDEALYIFAEMLK